MHLLQASTWRRQGCGCLAATAACTFIASYSNDPEDTLHAYAQLALIANERQGARSDMRCACTQLALRGQVVEQMPAEKAHSAACAV